MFQFFSKIIYPYSCLSCKKELKKSYICSDCFDKIPLLKEQICPACEKLSINGKTHPECKEETPLNGVFTAMDYKEKIVQKLIHRYKYKLVRNLGTVLSAILIKSLNNSAILLKTPIIITSVPLHRLKLRSRGFNQSEILAQNIAKQFNLPYKNILTRLKNTNSQKNIANLCDRRQNIKNAFKINPTNTLKPHDNPLKSYDTPLKPPNIPLESYKNSTIIIVDDITTTLSTLNECAKTIKLLQPKQIYGIVLARGI